MPLITFTLFLIFLNVTTSEFNLTGRMDTTMHQNGFATELLDCLSNITRTYFDRKTIYLCFNENLNGVDFDSFANGLKSPKVIMPYSSITEMERVKGVYVFLAEDGLYTKMLNIIQQSYFVAVWTRQQPMYNIRKVFRDFWGKGKHVNIIGLMTTDDGNSVDVFTYMPFTYYGCSKLGRPYMLNHWENGTFRSSVNLFSHKRKMGNMLGCPVKCVGNEHPPDTVMRYDGQQWSTFGVGGKVLDIVARYMNFTPVITSPKPGNLSEMYSWYNSGDVLDKITSMLYTEEVDLAFGWYSYAMYNNEYNIELARTTSIDCLGWAVPYRAGPSPQPWTNYVYEFDKISWMFIGSTLVIVVGVFYFFRKLKKLHRVDSVLFFVYHTAIDQPLRVQPSSCSIRTFMIHWLWYCMVINVAYKASLGSFMTVPPHGLEFTRMDQILDSNLTMMASPRSLHIMNATTATTRISRTFMKRLQQLPPTNFEHVIDRLVMKRDIALFEVKRFMYYYSIPQAKRIKVKIPIRFLPGCLLRTHTTQFMYSSGSYLTESVDATLSTLFETGIVDHWITHLGSNKVLPLEKIRGRVLKLVRLKEAFMFLFFSYAVASVVLIGEIFWSKRLHRRLIRFLVPTTRSNSTRGTYKDCDIRVRGCQNNSLHRHRPPGNILPFMH